MRVEHSKRKSVKSQGQETICEHVKDPAARQGAGGGSGRKGDPKSALSFHPGMNWAWTLQRLGAEKGGLLSCAE